MTPELTTVLTTGLALAAYLLVVAMALRLSAQAHALVMLLGSAGFVFAAAAMIIVSRKLDQVLIWHFLAFYCGGVAVTVFLYGAVLKSLSLQMCARLGPGACSIDHLAESVIQKAFVERIDLLDGGGLIERQGTDFAATEKGRATASRLSQARKALRLESKGLYAM